MPALRKKKSVGGHVPATSMNTRSTPAAAVGVAPTRRATEGQLAAVSVGTRGVERLPPPRARTSHAVPAEEPALPPNAIPSDTTEWDPSMVSPAKMDPAYRPAAPHIHNLRSGWGSSPAGKPASSSAFWTTVGVPEIGVFPTVPPGANSHITHLHPIPLDFSRETPARLGAAAVTGRGSSPLGRDIPPLPFTTAAPVRRTTRSSTLLPSVEQPVPQNGQPVDSQDSLAQQTVVAETEAQDQQKKLRKTRMIRERHQAGAVEHRQDVMRNGVQSSPAGQYVAAPGRTADPRSPPRIPASVQAAIDQIPRYLGPIAENPQAAGPTYLERITADLHLRATADHAPKYLQRMAVPPQSPKHLDPPAAVAQPALLVQNNTGINDRTPGSPMQSSLATVGQLGSQIEPTRAVENRADTNRTPLVTASHIPRYPGQTAAVVGNAERAVRDPLVPINHPVPVPRPADSISWMTPERPSSLPRPALPFPVPQDPSDPSFGTTRPGTESPDYFDDVDSSWVFMQSRQPPTTVYGCTPELETPLTSPSEDVAMPDADERPSGSTPTSYSQCPGSPTSLISMYRVHGDLTSPKPPGLSLLHTKRVYIGEKVLLDLDMPGGRVMDTREMARLMDGADAGLESVKRDVQTGGRCVECVRYVLWR